MTRPLVVGLALVTATACHPGSGEGRTVAAVAAQCPLAQTIGTGAAVPARYDGALPDCARLFRACEHWVVVQVADRGIARTPQVVEVVHRDDPMLRRAFTAPRVFDLDEGDMAPKSRPLRCDTQARLVTGRVTPVIAADE
ncbi:MAG: hypothetical protein AAF715_29750 [Myxococcota bacterium]